METLMQDIRYGIRTLLKNPGLMFIAVLTLGLGIGANTAIFSMVDSLLLRPLPLQDPGRIAVLAMQQKNGGVQPQFSIPDYQDIQKQTSESFSGLAAYLFGLDGLSSEGAKPERIMTSYVSGNFFSMLGLKPVLGRFILPSEGETLGADPVMVISYAYWKTHFGGDATIVGRKVSVDGHPITIIGVAPEGFYGVSPIVAIQGYLPISLAQMGGYPSDFMTNRSNHMIFVLGRLASSTDFQKTNASLGVVAQRLSQQYPDIDKDLSVKAYPELRSRPNPDPNNTVLVVSSLFLGLAALVLLLACVNVANILLVRATVREREMAIRAALGAARTRLIRQLLTESILLALMGGVVGILLGHWGSSAFGSLHLGTELPLRFDFHFDWRVFAYAFLFALVTGIVVGLVPAIRASRGNLNTILHAGGRGVVGGKNRLRSSLVVAQVAGSLTLLIIAGLFTRSLGKAQQTSLGFNPSHLLNMTMDPNEIGYNDVQYREFYKNLLERVRALPGVQSATIASSVPLGYINSGDTLTIEGYQPPPDQPPPACQFNIISSGYFETLEIPMLSGRTFKPTDDANTQYVAIVNEAMAKQFWPNTDPIGRQFKMGSDPKHWIQVVGVVKNARFQGLRGNFQSYFFLPFLQQYAANSLGTLQVRTFAAPEAMTPEIERVIGTLAPDLPVFDVNTMTQALNTLNGLLFYQIGAVLAALLGILGLILAVVGVYGVISYASSQKTHEIGVRMALGAQPMDILKMIFRQGLFIIVIGLVLGIAMALAAARLFGSFLAVSPMDPPTYIAVSAILATVALAACYIPARRAMNVDPMIALHYE
ncbi:MAG TPA: ABC transporter permease [Candidatus Acidoferrales bacterium]|jgi:predicted permease|nr:ABC transporter permease [Candidatus Acidoferrales bacterium]